LHKTIHITITTTIIIGFHIDSVPHMPVYNRKSMFIIGAKPNVLLVWDIIRQHVRKQAGTTTRDVWYTGVESMEQTNGLSKKEISM
jgi:hypothetical protein